ncbi:mRNA-decapping enzyme subunit 2 [Rhizina undulata]
MDSSSGTNVFSKSTLVEILDDLCVRFIINLPKEELSSVERVCFQIEEAQWYFEDYIREINPGLPTLPLRAFLSKIFAQCPLPLLANLPPGRAENAFIDFMAYKTRVPVRGAIMLNAKMDKCVLVKGWKSSASWSFPRGKINNKEDDMHCAVREVFEETGYDVSDKIREGDFVEITMRQQNMRLYLIPGVPEDTKFEPRTKKEISKIKWHHLSELPTYQGKKKNQANPFEVRSGKFYMVAPFLKELRKWIQVSGQKWQAGQKQASAAKVVYTEDETEIEEVIQPSPEPVDPSAGLKSILGLTSGAENGYSNAAENAVASQRLKNLLSIPSTQNTSSTQNTKEEASQMLRELFNVPSKVTPESETASAQSAELKNLLNIGGSKSNSGGISLENQPNAQALLSILQGGPVTATVAPQAAVPAKPQLPPSAPMSIQQLMASQNAQKSPPKLQPHTNGVSLHNHSPIHQQQYQYPPPSPPQQPTQDVQQKQLPVLQAQGTHFGGVGAGSFLPRFPRSNPQQPPQQSSSLPSPPPTSTFRPPPPPAPRFGAQQNQYSPTRGLQYPHAPSYQTSYSPSPNGPKMAARPPIHPPPTPLDAYMPPPVPTKPPDPAQAGTLLSILKGGGVPTSVSPAAPAAAVAPPPPPPETPTPSRTRRSISSQKPISLQPAPPPRGPRNATSGFSPSPRSKVIAQNSRPSTVTPPRQSYPAPVQRSMIAHPNATSFASPPTGPRASIVPTTTAQYGPVQTPKMPAMNFDRRDSVSNMQAQTLLAMFRQPGSAGAHEDAIVSSPEQEVSRPVLGKLVTGRRIGGAQPVRSPKGKEREGLLAYLEGVAKLGGQ